MWHKVGKKGKRKKIKKKTWHRFMSHFCFFLSQALWNSCFLLVFCNNHIYIYFILLSQWGINSHALWHYPYTMFWSLQGITPGRPPLLLWSDFACWVDPRGLLAFEPLMKRNMGSWAKHTAQHSKHTHTQTHMYCICCIYTIYSLLKLILLHTQCILYNKGAIRHADKHTHN